MDKLIISISRVLYKWEFLEIPGNGSSRSDKFLAIERVSRDSISADCEWSNAQ